MTRRRSRGTSRSKRAATRTKRPRRSLRWRSSGSRPRPRARPPSPPGAPPPTEVQGANIRACEAPSGVDVIIDDTPDTVVVSCFDPVRREVGRLALERLITDGRIHPGRIEEVVDKARGEVEASVLEAGEQAVYETGIKGMHPELVKLVGRMAHRTSYGQNILEHSKEVTWLAGIIAAELKLDA